MFTRMESDSVVPSTEAGGEVMASVEDDTTLIIADISCDDAYLSAPLAVTATLSDWQ
jgi:hypothetical protein